MMKAMFNSTTIPILEQMVGFTQARHGVLAGNIANLNTPGYRVRDLSVESFQEHLRQEIETRHRGTAEPPSSPGISQPESGAGRDSVRESLTSILQHDETNVGAEQQVAELSKNYFLHNVSISVLNSQFRLLQTAIAERV